MIFLDLLKSEAEMWIEIREFTIFEKKTSRQIHKIKNHWIWIKIHGEIIEWTGEKFLKLKFAKNKN